MTIEIKEPLKAMRIGVDNVIWCKLESDTGDALPVYSDFKPSASSTDFKKFNIVPLPGVMTMNVNPNSSIETAFYDDGPGEVATTLGNIEVTFNKSSLAPPEKALLLGKVLDTNGVLYNSKTDIPPWGALGFRTLKSDGTYKYVWLFKGKFTEPADNNETKGESINFQSDEITGRFVKLNYEFNIKDFSNETAGVDTLVKSWKVELDSLDSLGEVAQFIWNNIVVLPNTNLLPSDFTNPVETNKGYIIWSCTEQISSTDTTNYVSKLHLVTLKDVTSGEVVVTKEGTGDSGKYKLPTANCEFDWTLEKQTWDNKHTPTSDIDMNFKDLNILYSSVNVKEGTNIIFNKKEMPGLTIS